MISCGFQIPGPPQPWARWRTRGWSRWLVYREHIRYTAAAHVPRDWPGPEWPDRRATLTLDLFFGDLRTRDPDNVQKGIMDALRGILWRDDNWPRFSEIKIRSALDRDRPRVELACHIPKGTT